MSSSANFSIDDPPTDPLPQVWKVKPRHCLLQLIDYHTYVHFYLFAPQNPYVIMIITLDIIDRTNFLPQISCHATNFKSELVRARIKVYSLIVSGVGRSVGELAWAWEISFFYKFFKAQSFLHNTPFCII